jgi:hypothetical protein
MSRKEYKVYTQANCPNCQESMRFEKRGINPLLHGLLSLFTMGAWLPIWGILYLFNTREPYKCPTCGFVRGKLSAVVMNLVTASIVMAIGMTTVFAYSAWKRMITPPEEEKEYEQPEEAVTYLATTPTPTRNFYGDPSGKYPYPGILTRNVVEKGDYADIYYNAGTRVMVIAPDEVMLGTKRLPAKERVVRRSKVDAHDSKPIAPVSFAPSHGKSIYPYTGVLSKNLTEKTFYGQIHYRAGAPVQVTGPNEILFNGKYIDVREADVTRSPEAAPATSPVATQ